MCLIIQQCIEIQHLNGILMKPTRKPGGFLFRNTKESWTMHKKSGPFTESAHLINYI